MHKLMLTGVVLLLIPIGLVINGFYQEHHRCVRLPNGVIVAYEAYMSFWRPFFYRMWLCAALKARFLAAAMTRTSISRKRQPTGLILSRVQRIPLAKAQQASSIIPITAWSGGQTIGFCVVSLSMQRALCWKKAGG